MLKNFDISKFQLYDKKEQKGTKGDMEAPKLQKTLDILKL